MTTNPLIRVALIGAGRIGINHAALIARDIPNAELIAIADPVEGAAAKLAETLGVEQSYTDIAALLARPDLDAVVITAPPRFHTALVEQAAAQLIDDGLGVERRRDGADHRHQHAVVVEVGGDGGVDAGVLDLDRHVGAVVELVPGRGAG